MQFSISFVENRLEINLTQSEWVQIQFAIRINSYFHSDWKFGLDWFGSILIENLIRIRSDRNLGLNRINFQPIYKKRNWNLFRLIPIGLDTDFGIYWKEISIESKILAYIRTNQYFLDLIKLFLSREDLFEWRIFIFFNQIHFLERRKIYLSQKNIGLSYLYQ